MPELPEVETIRLQLNNVLRGLIIKDVEILNSKSFIGNKKEVIGKKVIDIRRFGKLLVIDLNDNLNLGIHLKMSGQLIYRGKKQPSKLKVEDEDIKNLPNKHTRIVVKFSNRDHLYFNDVRKFGWMKIISNIKDQISKLGIEPFTKEFTLENFKKVLNLSKKAIKLVLMDQEKIAGVGNIYANDALFCAKINPKNKAKDLNEQEVNKLFNCILEVLKNGIKWKGASENSYRDAFGQKGRLQEHFLVYAREGKICPRNCGEKIKKFMLGGRGTYFCPKCQS